MQQPIVSIIVPCFNQAHFLPESLDSVLQQTYVNWECIIVNDGSTDSTEVIAKEWTLKDARFSCISIKNGGLSNARNTGIKNALGIYILPLDADDKLEPNYIALAVEAFQNSTELKVVYCKAIKFGSVEGSWDLQDFSLDKLAYINMIFCSALFYKKDWEVVGGYDPKMKYGWEDWEFWISLLKNGGEVKRLPYVGFQYRINEASMLHRLDASKKKVLFDYMSVKHADFYVKYVGNFQDLAFERYTLQNKYKALLKSKKHAVNVFCYALLGWKPFRIQNEDSLKP
ncbi:MAG: glycosyl transferase family 2 [Flavobacteriaceae bacterium]|nr:glycosyl transferase family 2 [Flavobacteriaceae bacterium]|tara:strand:- start:1200 stop:2054 length:855 start_codon:yes stop_codon:yes gene_type:complete